MAGTTTKTAPARTAKATKPAGIKHEITDAVATKTYLKATKSDASGITSAYIPLAAIAAAGLTPETAKVTITVTVEAA